MKANSIYTSELQAPASATGDLASLETAVLTYALEYARMGWPVFPLNGKIPLAGSHGYQDATTDEAKIREWYTARPYANVALKTGLGFFVLDVDPRHGGDKTLAVLEEKHGRLGETIRQDSGGGGTHYFFALPPDRIIKCSEGKVGPGIDIRGEGGYVVAEPSLHHDTGELYTFVNFADAELAQCPGWLLDLICPLSSEDRPELIRKKIVSIADDLIAEGERNDKLFRHAAKLRGTGMKPKGILSALSIVNDELCIPPLNHDELQKIVTSVCRYKAGPSARQMQKAHVREAQGALAEKPVADENWMNRLELSSEGKPFKNISNVAVVLEFHPECHKALAWNECTHTLVTQRPLCGGRIPAYTVLEEHHVLEITAWLQSHADLKVGVAVADDAISMVGRRYGFHPLREYLTNLKHDGKQRVDCWLTTYLKVEQNPYTTAVGRCWLISAVARVMQPGCKADCCLILEGEQGIGKSTALSILGGEWFTDSLNSMNTDKDSLMQLRGKWIIEIGELSALTRGEVTQVKSFMSRSSDNYRIPYGRKAIDVPRECVFAGTTNSSSYLKDETGNRRFWPVECKPVTGEMLDRDGLKRDRDQLWAEAYAMYMAGQSWHLSNPAVLRASQEAQEGRVELDPWHELVQKYTEGLQTVKIENILQGTYNVADRCVLGIGKRREDWTQQDRNRIGRILKQEGWKRTQKRVDGRVECVYERKL